MAKNELDSFKIAETRKPGVSAPKKGEAAAPAGEAQSLGFKRIEGLLEREDRATVQASLSRLKESLATLERGAKAAKDKAAAKKAIAAVDRAGELMNFLYDTKDSLARTAPK